MRWKNPKYLFWAGILTVALVAMIYFDQEKVYKEEEPPIPTVKVGSTKLDVGLGTYRWNDQEVEKKMYDLNMELTYKQVVEDGELNIDFPKGQEPIYKTWGWIDTSSYGVYPLSYFNEDDPISYYAGDTALALTAHWKGGKKAVYMLKFSVQPQETSIQVLLSSDEDKYNVTLVNATQQEADNQENLALELNEEFYQIVSSWNLWSTLEEMKTFYPELAVEAAPTYLVFDSQKEVLRSANLEEVKAFLREKDRSGPATIEGKVTKAVPMTNQLTVSGESFYSAEPIHELEVGQTIQIHSTHYIKGTMNQVDSYEILQASPIKIKKEWLAKKYDHISIITVNQPKYHQEILKKDFKTIEKINHLPSIEDVHGKNINTPTYYIFDNLKLLLQTDSYQEALDFCYEQEVMAQ